MDDKRYELLLQLNTQDFATYGEAVEFSRIFPSSFRWAIRDRQTGALYDPALDGDTQGFSLRAVDRG